MINTLSYIFGVGIVISVFLFTYVALPRMLFVKSWTSELNNRELRLVKYGVVAFGAGCVFFLLKILFGY